MFGVLRGSTFGMGSELPQSLLLAWNKGKASADPVYPAVHSALLFGRWWSLK